MDSMYLVSINLSKLRSCHLVVSIKTLSKAIAYFHNVERLEFEYKLLEEDDKVFHLFLNHRPKFDRSI